MTVGLTIFPNDPAGFNDLAGVELYVAGYVFDHPRHGHVVLLPVSGAV